MSGKRKACTALVRLLTTFTEGKAAAFSPTLLTLEKPATALKALLKETTASEPTTREKNTGRCVGLKVGHW